MRKNNKKQQEEERHVDTAAPWKLKKEKYNENNNVRNTGKRK